MTPPYMIKYLTLAIVIFSMVFLSVSPAQANGFGITVDKVVGDYTVNMDYDAIIGIFANDPVQFAFQLFNKNRTQPVSFTDVWVTITPTSKEKNYTPPLFDGGLIGSLDLIPAGMTLAFPKSGSYDLNIRFDKDNKTLAEATFPLKVGDTEGTAFSVTAEGLPFSKNFLTGALGVLGLEALLYGCWLVLKAVRSKKS